MNTSKDLIEAARAAIAAQRGVAARDVSDYAVAHAIGLSKQAMSRQIHGASATLSTRPAIRAARLAGLDPGVILASIQAEKETDADAQNEWRRIARALAVGARAAAFFVLAALLSLFAAPDQATASAMRVSSSENCVLC